MASKGEFSAALDEIAFILARDPNDFAGLENRCTLLDRQDRAIEALVACTKGVKLYPHDLWLRSTDGVVNMKNARLNSMSSSYQVIGFGHLDEWLLAVAMSE
ncbi:hypothetical protein [Bradyrhizobium canariense]|uniref:hypothetical protein n=1 Tax=Bradyrhizobium canariense TaxID=255045 RepID=UPI00142F9C6F|nr:hypothetical protein [Bradyrhizobium canariense]